MNESSLSQQLRKAIEAAEKAHHEPGWVSPEVMLSQETACALLTEHEALQRKADAGEALLVCVDNHSCDGQGDCWVSMDAFVTAYHEATKLPDV